MLRQYAEIASPPLRVVGKLVISEAASSTGLGIYESQSISFLELESAKIDVVL